MKARRPILLLVVLAGLAGYWGLFFAAGMPSVERITGGPFPRAAIFRFLVVPEDLAAFWFGTPPELALADRLPVLAIAAAILGWAAAFGWLLLALLRADKGFTRLESLVFSTAVGLNAISTLTLAAGLCRWLHYGIVFLAPAAITAAAAVWLGWRRRGLRGSGFRVRGSGLPVRRRPPCTPSAGHPTSPTSATGQPPLSPYWLWLAIPFAAITLLGSMLPPLEFDVREYHLQVPKEFYQQGWIGFLPHNVYGNMPLGMEMLSLLAMVVAGDWWLGALAGKTLIGLMAPLTALGLFAAGRRLFSPPAGVAAALLYLSTPWVVQVSSLGLVDAAVGCYLLLATYALVLAWGAYPRPGEDAGRSPSVDAGGTRIRRVLLSGYLAGAAVSCKYPGLLFVVVPLAAWIVLAGTARAGLWRGGGKPLGAFLLAAAIACGLWFGKNAALAGNPTYPLLYPLFGGKTRTAEKDRQWSRAHRPHDFSLAALGSDVLRVLLSSEWLSPLVMPLAALALVGKRPPRGAWVLAAEFGFVVAAWWLLTHRIDRFWIPALPLAALLAGEGACWGVCRIGRWPMTVLLLAGAVYCFLAASSLGGGYNRYFISLDRARRDPDRVAPWHRYLNAQVQQGSVLLVGDAQPFDLEMPVLYNTCFDDSLFEQLVKDRTAAEIRAALAQRQIVYVLVHWGEIRRYRAPGNYGFPEFVQPEVFQRLVDEGILVRDPAAVFQQAPVEGYRVVW